MLNLKQMLEKYRQDHQHPVNRALHSVGIPMILFAMLIFPFNPIFGIVLFVFGWILQFVGHAFEGKWPSFFSDPRYLLVGPIWIFKKLTGRVDAAVPSPA